MKMDRNTNSNGLGKYALVKLRGESNGAADLAIHMLRAAGKFDYGLVGSESEFFVIRLKDINAAAALTAYASEAERTDPEWAAEVREMVSRAGPNSRFCKVPD